MKESKTYPPDEGLDKCECGHFRQDHWRRKYKCLSDYQKDGWIGKDNCKEFVLKEKHKGFIAIIENE